jgi:predicted DNA-binding protein (MmcQ/YjbR family)
MNIEYYRDYCLSLPGVTEDIKWGNLCFLIANKIFVIIDIDGDQSFAIKCQTEDFDELTARYGMIQAPHFAKRQWVKVLGLDVFGVAELKQRVAISRALVLAKLPKKIQAKYL